MRKFIFIAMLVSLAVAAFISPLASSSPDGLERVAADKGFIQLSEGKETVKSPLSNYRVPGLKNETMAGSMAGVFGTILVFAAMYGLGKFFAKRARRAREEYDKSVDFGGE